MAKGQKVKLENVCITHICPAGCEAKERGQGFDMTVHVRDAAVVTTADLLVLTGLIGHRATIEIIGLENWHGLNTEARR